MKFQIVKEARNADKMGTDITVQDVDSGMGQLIYFVDFKMGSGDAIKLIKRILEDLNFEIGTEIKVIKQSQKNDR